MEENDKKIEVDTFKVSQGIPTKESNFAIKYVIFLLILIAITALAVLSAIRQINKESASKNKQNNTEIIKRIDTDDNKYVITSYAETYDNNSIKITEYYDIDGKVSKDDSNYEYYKSRVQYIQIEGLKNKKIQNEINQKLRNIAYSIKHQDTYTYVSANFSNILSVVIYNDENETKSLNINLATGEEIKFQDLFIKSAPINLYLINSLYETLVWQNADFGFGDGDASKVDMSDYEDKFLMLINNYNKSKDNLTYYISASALHIYGIIDKNIFDNEYADRMTLTLDLTKCINEVAMYKKFLTNESIYEDDSIGIKGTIVFTESNEYFETRLNYGKIKDNIFLEETVLSYQIEYYTDKNLEIARQFIEKLSKEAKSNLISQAKSNRGIICQREYQTWYSEENNYTVVYTNIYQATCSTEYFKNEAFLDYIRLKNMPGGGDVTLKGFSQYMKNDFPNLSISEEKYEVYYLNQEGEVIAKSYEEFEEFEKKSQMQNEVQNEITNEETDTTDVNNSIVNNTETEQNTINTNENNPNTDNKNQKNETPGTNAID